MIVRSRSGLCSLLALLLLFPAMLAAQQQVVMNEEFNDNVRNWWQNTGETWRGSISNGVYSITSRLENQPWSFLVPVFLYSERDYTIEMAVRQISGMDNYGFGITWGAVDGSNAYHFAITSNGYARIQHAQNGNFQDLQAWTQTSAVNAMGETNVLVIERRGGRVRYLVNDVEVATTSAYPFYGGDIGFRVEGLMEVEVDRIVVRQDQPPPNVVPNMPAVIEKINLGAQVNSPYSEIIPLISPDGSTLYFCREYHPENSGGVADRGEIWMSRSLADGTWDKAERLGVPLNNTGPNWVISVMPDNNTLLLANQYTPDGGPKGNGLSLTHRTADGWGAPVDVVVKNLVNNSSWYQFCLSSDRKVLLLSVVDDNTNGKHDIYVSFQQSDGTWSQPKNLGPVVNSFGEEAGPALASDGVTLFFSSNGRPGYGLSDLYVTRRLDESWERWSEPQNLGPAINTAGDDGNFSIPSSGDFAYIVSTTNSLGSFDIFRLKLPEAIRPNPVVLISGTVIDSKTRKPIGADITYRDLASDQEVGVASSNPADGSYKIVLPAGRSYSFMADEQGYYAVSDNLEVKELKEYREIKRDLYLTPIEVGATIRLNNLFFDFAKADLRTESFPELNRATKFLRDNPGIAIEVAGHTDNVGSDEANRKLSDDRARAVKEYLIAQGVQSERIVSKGYGESKPVATNNTDEGRQLNRRVDFTIVRR